MYHNLPKILFLTQIINKLISLFSTKKHLKNKIKIHQDFWLDLLLDT